MNYLVILLLSLENTSKHHDVEIKGWKRPGKDKMKTENQTRVKDERNKEHVVSEVEDQGN